jgi:N-acetylglucosamine kinase-like BadF-type ATPase
MILIAESGSTKTGWVLVNENHDISMFYTIGFNPFFHDDKIISKHITENVEFYDACKNVNQIYFYGAGCSSKELNSIIEHALKGVFTKADVYVEHDLLACALSTYEDEPSISCILGTGSNSCYFDGENLIEEVPALGYVLGDEGSGSYFGKKLLSDYLYNRLPDQIKDDLECHFSISKATIFENVYMKPNANVYLASFMRFITNHKEHDYVSNMVENGMDQFMKTHVCCYDNYKDVKTHFIGSLSAIYEKELRSAAKKNDVVIGNIVRKPVNGLVNYHLRNLNK